MSFSVCHAHNSNGRRLAIRCVLIKFLGVRICIVILFVGLPGHAVILSVYPSICLSITHSLSLTYLSGCLSFCPFVCSVLATFCLHRHSTDFFANFLPSFLPLSAQFACAIPLLANFQLPVKLKILSSVFDN